MAKQQLPSTDRPSAGGRQVSEAISRTIRAVVLVALLLSLFGILWASRESDIVSVDRQARLASLAMESSVDELALEQETVAVWDESTKQALKAKPDQQWLDWNVGGYLNQLFHHDEVYVLNGRDEPIYATVSGKMTEPGKYAAVRKATGHLVDSLRGRIREQAGTHDRLPGMPLNPATTVRTRKGSRHDSHLVLVNGRPAAASAMLMDAPTPGYVSRDGGMPVIVSVRYLDETFLPRLASRELISEPRFSKMNQPAADEYSVPMKTEWGAPMGYLIWKPELPGTRILERLLPFTLLLLSVLVLFTAVVSRRLRRSAVDLAEAEARAAHLAYHDGLTGLPNRMFLQERLGEWIVRERKHGRGFTLAMLDVDEFKLINDTQGHDAGDAVLLAFAQRLSDAMGPDDIVARLGGDEFAILLRDIIDDDAVEAMGHALLELLRQPCQHNDQSIACRASIGTATFAPGDSAATMMKHADLALYEAKASGRGISRQYDPSMWRGMLERRDMLGAAEQALQEDRIRPHYQAKVALDTGRIVGFEALLRYRNDAGEWLGPDGIAAAFDEASLASRLSQRMVELVAADMSSWNRAGVNYGHVAVNASAGDLQRGDFAERIMLAIDSAGIDAAKLQIEVTESVLIGRGIDHVERTFRELAGRGIRLALDDFGTGFASLSHLKQFPVEIIKIDRSFVRDLQVDAGDGAIVDALIGLGSALKMDVVAEGIETMAQRDFLHALGCRYGQGFLFGGAIPASDVAAAIRDNFAATRRAA